MADRLASDTQIENFFDSLHLALASLQSCTYFLSCDDELIWKSKRIETALKSVGYNLKIRNPVDFLKEMGVKL